MTIGGVSGTTYGHDGEGWVTNVTRGDWSASLYYNAAGRPDYTDLSNGVRTSEMVGKKNVVELKGLE